MHEDNHADELDRLIDQALSSYGAEPPAHLETKIVAESRSTPMLVKKSAPARWVSIASGIAAAGLLGSFLMHDTVRQVRQTTAQQDRQGLAQQEPVRLKQTKLAKPLSSAHLEKATAAVHHPVVERNERKTAYTEAPMTAQEERLVSLALHHPELLRPFFATENKEAMPLSFPLVPTPPIISEPIKIEAIKTEPLPLDTNN